MKKQKQNIRNDSPELIHPRCMRNRLARVLGFTRKSESFGTVERNRCPDFARRMRMRALKSCLFCCLGFAVLCCGDHYYCSGVWIQFWSVFLIKTGSKKRSPSSQSNANPSLKTLFHPSKPSQLTTAILDMPKCKKIFKISP